MATYGTYPNYNQFYGQPMQQQMQIPKVQPMEQFQQYTPPQYTQPQTMYKQSVGLQGKSVDSIDVVKAMDIPLDFSISYFPLTDGSAIVTKQLQTDGTSKTVVYKPVNENETKNVPKYITEEELEERIKNVDNDDIKDDIKELKRKVEDLVEDVNSINKDMKKRKD